MSQKSISMDIHLEEELIYLFWKLPGIPYPYTVKEKQMNRIKWNGSVKKNYRKKLETPSLYPDKQRIF